FATNDPLNNPYSFAVTGTVLLFPLADTINVSGSAGPITLVLDGDHQHVDWSGGGNVGELSIADPNGLTINGDGANDVLTLNGTRGDPLPSIVHLNGIFTINGLTGAAP